MINSGGITIRPMKVTDYPLMAKWLTDPRVYKYLHGKAKDIHYVKKKYGPGIKKTEDINSCFIEYSNMSIGYVQYFNIRKYEKDYELENTKNIWAIDIWIGEPEYWERGIGTKTLKLLVNYIFKNHQAEKIIIDPHTDNPRAIRVYEKVGFKKVKILKNHEKYKDTKVDAWLMELNK